MSKIKDKEKRKRMIRIFKTVIKGGVKELTDLDLISADIYAREMVEIIREGYKERTTSGK